MSSGDQKKPAPPVEAWAQLGSETVYEARIFSVRRNRSRSPRTGRDHDFFVLDSQDWVNIIPITPDGGIVLVRQYRHGIADLSLEVPGGLIDPEDPSPLAAARREMNEETGYDADDIVPLGWVHPNPALQGNRCYTFLARGAVPRFEPRMEGTEETEVVLVPESEIPALIRSGGISHALVVVAFAWQWMSEDGGFEKGERKIS